MEAIKKLLPRPKGIPEPRGVGSRERVISSKLTRLGAMRLLNQHCYARADKEAQAAEIPMPDEPNAPKLREQVRMEMLGMFKLQVFDTDEPLVAADEFPIHWETQTERERRNGT